MTDLDIMRARAIAGIKGQLSKPFEIQMIYLQYFKRNSNWLNHNNRWAHLYIYNNQEIE